MSAPFNYITPHLAQGSAPPLGFSGPFDAIVLCAREYQDRALDRALTKHGRPVEILRVPLQDRIDRYPSVAEVALAMRVAKRAASLLERKRKVLVTCQAGINRSGLVSALTLMEMGYSSSGAISAVRAARDEAAIYIGLPMALCNGRFVELLDAVQKKREGKRWRKGSSKSSSAA